MALRMTEDEERVERAQPLRRPHVKHALMRELAAGQMSQTQLAAKYGVTQPAISNFLRRHRSEVEYLRDKLDDEWAGIWAASKVNRVLMYQRQIEDIADMLEDGRSSVPTAEMMRTAQSAARAIADELGQIPQRVQMELGGKFDVTVNGVDVGNLK